MVKRGKVNFSHHEKPNFLYEAVISGTPHKDIHNNSTSYDKTNSLNTTSAKAASSGKKQAISKKSGGNSNNTLNTINANNI
jgi:hypothetical protein